MIELGAEAEPLERERFPKLLRQAHDAEIIDLSKEDDGAYAVRLRPEAVVAAQPEAEPEADEGAKDERESGDEEPLRASSAASEVASQPAPLAGIPARSARFRRGSRGLRVPPPEVQKIGVVEVDPNFKPRIELIPARPVVPETVGTDTSPSAGGLPGSAPIEDLGIAAVIVELRCKEHSIPYHLEVKVGPRALWPRYMPSGDNLEGSEDPETLYVQIQAIAAMHARFPKRDLLRVRSPIPPVMSAQDAFFQGEIVQTMFDVSSVNVPVDRYWILTSFMGLLGGSQAFWVHVVGLLSRTVRLG